MPGPLRAVTDWAAAMRTVTRLLRDGGVTVSTPAGGAAPAVTTLIQLDGDSITYVSAHLLHDYPASADRAALLCDHLERLSAALPAPPNLGAAAWVLVGAVTVAAQAALFGIEPWNGVAAIGTHIAGLGPLILRRVALRLGAGLLRWAARRTLRRERKALGRDIEARGKAAIRRV